MKNGEKPRDSYLQKIPIDRMPRKDKKRYNDDKEDPGSCCYCLKSFETLPKFLRHVSHSKLCLEAHDPDVIHELKKKSQLKSKRKWYHKKEASRKSKNPTKPKTNQLFQGKCWRPTNKMKRSDRGKSFHALLLEIFEGSSEKTVRSKLQDLSKVDPISGVKTYAFDESMDKAFKEESITSIFRVINDEKETLRRSGNVKARDQYDNEDFVLEKAFQRIENCFQVSYDRLLVSVADNWIEGIFRDMADGLFDYTWNHGLSHFYDQKIFKETTETAQDNALDKIFNHLIFDENYFMVDVDNLPIKLASIYETILIEEFKRLSNENGFATLVESFLEEKWIRKFKKFGLKYEIIADENK